MEKARRAGTGVVRTYFDEHRQCFVVEAVAEDDPVQIIDPDALDR
jgi:hypothetical protein